MIRLEYEQTVQLLKEVVYKVGEDYVYPHKDQICMYFERQAPSCIVGHVLDHEGVTHADIRSKNENGVVSLIESNIIEPEDQRVVDLLEQVQMHQDNGIPWGDALTKAIASVEQKM